MPGRLAAGARPAVDDRLIARNPADRIKRPKIPYKEAAYFDPATADQIVENINEPYRLLFRILAITGLRWGEGVALRRRHVDLLRRRLRVQGLVSGGEWQVHHRLDEDARGQEASLSPPLSWLS